MEDHINNGNVNQSTSMSGCGKWLTTKGKSNPKSCVKPSINQNQRKKPRVCFRETNSNSYITRAIFPDIQYKSASKQRKIDKFLINKSSECRSPIKHSSKVKIPISFPMKSGMAMDLNEYEDLWGSESEDEDGNCEILFNSQMSSKIAFPRPTATTSHPTASCNMAKNMSSDIRIDINKKDDERQDEVFLSPKKLKKADDDPVSLTYLTPKCYSSTNEFPFTQWFQGQVDEFCKYSSEIKKSDLMKDILSSVPYCYLSSPKSKKSSFKQESPLMFQFSEWFNQQIERFSLQSSSSKDNESSEDSPGSQSKISKQSFAFTQWFEENLEKCLKNQSP